MTFYFLRYDVLVNSCFPLDRVDPNDTSWVDRAMNCLLMKINDFGIEIKFGSSCVNLPQMIQNIQKQSLFSKFCPILMVITRKRYFIYFTPKAVPLPVKAYIISTHSRMYMIFPSQSYHLFIFMQNAVGNWNRVILSNVTIYVHNTNHSICLAKATCVLMRVF